jgi:uncharacterized RDD family membrane protein YckC
VTAEPQGHVDPIPHQARPYQGHPAGVVTRLVAAVLDCFVVGIILACLYLGWAGLLLLIEGRNFTFPHAGLFFTLTAAFVVSFFYLTIFWALTGRTYGDVVMGLRVQRSNGRRLRLFGAALRAAFCLVFPIGILWVPVSRGNKSLQDAVLTTRVIYDWKPRAPRIPAQPAESDA